MARRLSIKEITFCEKVVEGNNVYQAFKMAGYAPHHNNPYRLIRRPRVTSHINHLRANMAHRHVVTTDSIIAELEEARAKADTLQQPAAMVQAIVAKAKAAGIWTEKSERTNKDDFSDKSVEELRAMLQAELAEAANHLTGEYNHISDNTDNPNDPDGGSTEDAKITNEIPKTIN